MQAIGDELFIQNYAGVYAGPDAWRRICDGVTLGLMTSADGKKLIIPRLKNAPPDGLLDPLAASPPNPQVERGTYDPQTKQLTWEDWPIPDDSREASDWDALAGCATRLPRSRSARRRLTTHDSNCRYRANGNGGCCFSTTFRTLRPPPSSRARTRSGSSMSGLSSGSIANNSSKRWVPRSSHGSASMKPRAGVC